MVMEQTEASEHRLGGERTFDYLTLAFCMENHHESGQRSNPR